MILCLCILCSFFVCLKWILCDFLFCFNFYYLVFFVFFQVNNTQGARGHTEYGIFVRQAQRAKKKNVVVVVMLFFKKKYNMYKIFFFTRKKAKNIHNFTTKTTNKWVLCMNGPEMRGFFTIYQCISLSHYPSVSKCVFFFFI